MNVTEVPSFFTVAGDDSFAGRSLNSGALHDAYDAEVADQAAKCRVEPYNAALYSALVRRINRNLAMKPIPLGVVMNETGGRSIGSTDPEVRRLEAPYRKLLIG